MIPTHGVAWSLKLNVDPLDLRGSLAPTSSSKVCTCESGDTALPELLSSATALFGCCTQRYNDATLRIARMSPEGLKSSRLFALNVWQGLQESWFGSIG